MYYCYGFVRGHKSRRAVGGDGGSARGDLVNIINIFDRDNIESGACLVMYIQCTYIHKTQTHSYSSYILTLFVFCMCVCVVCDKHLEGRDWRWEGLLDFIVSKVKIKCNTVQRKKKRRLPSENRLGGWCLSIRWIYLYSYIYP